MSVAELPPFDLLQNEPLQIQIHHQLVTWITSGRLAPGDRLPATRRISQQLGVSRNTVTAVIEQLKAEGFVVSQVGRGCFVTNDLPVMSVERAKAEHVRQPAEPPLSDLAQTFSQANVASHAHCYPFTPGIPDLERFPQAIWQKLWRRHQGRPRLLGYDNPQGHEPLRIALADYLRVSRAVQCTPQQILITQGAQQAITLCAQLLVNNGETILHENPGYRGASYAFAARKLTQIAVPLQHQAVDVDWLNTNATGLADARLLYTCPTHQYPMGGLLPAAARLALLDWAAKQKVWIIEDDYDSEFHFQHKPVAAMQGMTSNNNVIYMGSFSKTLLPSLRLGYLVLPENLVSVFTQAKHVNSGESSLIPQAVIADFITEGHFARHLRRMRMLYKQKWLEMQHRIQTVLADRVTMIAESAGMHLVLEIPDVNDVALCSRLQSHGFGGSPLSSYYLGNAEKTGLVLGFANSNEIQRQQLVSRIDSLLT